MALLRQLATRTDDHAGLHEVNFQDGAIVCRQGGRARSLCHSCRQRQGFARARRHDRSAVRLQTGQSFGELGLIDGRPRAANVVAEGGLRVLTISGEDFAAPTRRTNSPPSCRGAAQL